jgi:Uma2 family endonuclease
MSLLAMSNATLDDLMQYKPRAELINGRIVPLMPHGDNPGEAGLQIVCSIRDYANASGVGRAVNDGVAYGFQSPLPSGRLSISPDASYTLEPRGSGGMKYIPGIPLFAVEVRSDSDYGPKMDREYDIKRNDYFTAGTIVVWDVDPVAETVTKYTSFSDSTVFHRGEIADAEPALPGWRLPVDDIFRI